MLSAHFKNLLFWLAVFAVAFLIMARPSNAETIAASSGIIYVNGYVTSNLYYGQTAIQSCTRAATAAGKYFHAVVGGTTIQCWAQPNAGNTTGAYILGTMTTAQTCAPNYDTAAANCVASYSCPTGQNWTLSGSECVRPDCVLPQVRSSSTGVCKNCADNGTLYNQGFYDVGDDPLADHPPLLTCTGMCVAVYNGSNISARGLVGGVYHYYAKGYYLLDGKECSSGQLTPGVVAAVPAGTCAEGQSSITFNGETKCLNSSGAIVSTSSASSVASAQTISDAAKAAAVQSAGVLASSSGLGASGVEAAQATAAGAIGASFFNTGDPVLDAYCLEHQNSQLCSSSAAAGAASGVPSSEFQDFCTTNPSSMICVGEDYGQVNDVDLTVRNINVAITPVSVGGAGSCPADTAMTIHGQTHYFKWGTYCNFATGIKPILLAFAWLSAAGLMVGGFKTE